jgi:plasmid stabilization system protein ParE
MQRSNKEYTVKITETAWEMLTVHSRFIANVSMSAADKLVEQFLEAADSLTAMPKRNPFFEHYAVPHQKYRKLFLGKHYMTLYEIIGEIVYVSAVVDLRQDYIWLLT